MITPAQIRDAIVALGVTPLVWQRVPPAANGPEHPVFIFLYQHRLCILIYEPNDAIPTGPFYHFVTLLSRSSDRSALIRLVNTDCQLSGFIRHLKHRAIPR